MSKHNRERKRLYKLGLTVGQRGERLVGKKLRIAIQLRLVRKK